MDRISNLSDDLLLKIFSSIPTKDVVATMLLSKRWRFVWKMVPRLQFVDGFKLERFKPESYSEFDKFRKYVDRSLVSNRAPVLEALKLDVGLCCSSQDIATWIRIGMARHVSELEVVRCKECVRKHATIKLPKTLYTYEKLQVLKLADRITLDVPIDVCFPSLKTLHLMCVEYETEECFGRLLSGCPVLEELVFDRTKNNCFSPSLYVEMPNLQRLSILDTSDKSDDGVCKIVINVQSLKYLNFVDFFGDSCLCESMPEVVEANVKVVYKSPEKLLRSLPSVQRLYLCLSASMRQHHIVFRHLVHLKLCTDSLGWWDLLTWMLESSPKLQVLKICECNEHQLHRYAKMPIKFHWKRPTSVPECLMFHLHTFKWNDYNINDQEKEIVAYILKNARQLKTACISSSYYRKFKELASLPRASSSCQLQLDS